jgi:hypothetical protein
MRDWKPAATLPTETEHITNQNKMSAKTKQTKPACPTLRRRPLIAGKANADPITPELAAKFRALHNLNVAMNEATKQYTKQRKDLLVSMKAAGLTRAVVGALVAEVAAPEREVINCAKLKTSVTPAVFMQCISATKKAVTDYAGAAVASACAVLAKGEENVTVKPAK